MFSFSLGFNAPVLDTEFLFIEDVEVEGRPASDQRIKNNSLGNLISSCHLSTKSGKASLGSKLTIESQQSPLS
ncbi:hypothetical protein GcM3_013011 [Golovinomyces cichoracearum]|uniref:Uncharacterized protein n=1 Tax=Golovinomyces cichoracearum TaxID=62708 RepID=A0A420J9A1_9PEZI|nr:hypothetical protein GcM3_013011 [Golovinomyces cichoracearum]